MRNYQKLNDDELVSLLYTEGGSLSREVVDEIVRRGERMIAHLSDVVSDKYNWNQDYGQPEWWPVIHTVYILGAIGTKDTVVPLIRALRWADAYDIGYVTDELPSIFGKIGMPAMDYLKVFARDKTSENYSRILAIAGLAAITINNTKTEDEVFSCIYSIFQDEEEVEVKHYSAHVLIDFLRSEHKEALLALAWEDMRLEEEFGSMALFKEDEIEDAFSKKEKNLLFYTSNWLSFYDADKIRNRQAELDNEFPEIMGIEDDESDREDIGEEKISRPFVRDMSEIGRNEPCPCGSGKKYKKCCMGKDKTIRSR